MVEVWLLQNVVKLWIVKRLYEFVLFARHLATFLSLSSLRALSLARSLSSFLLPLSCLLQSARGYVDSLPSSCGRVLCALLDTDGLARNIFLSRDRRNSYVVAIRAIQDLPRWTWVRFLSRTFDRLRRSNVRAAKDDNDDGRRQLIAVAGFIRAMPRRDHRKTYLLKSC